jgi:hypothetical protein
MEADIFCGKKWYCEMTKYNDGTIHPTEKSKTDDYMHFLCDSSSFILFEGGISLKGDWTFDEATMIITLHQKQQSTISNSFAFHIIEYDDTHCNRRNFTSLYQIIILEHANNPALFFGTFFYSIS